MKHDIFYKNDHLDLATKLAILEDAYKVANSWHVDLKRHNDMARQPTDLSFEDSLKFLTDKCHYVIIHRMFPEDEQRGEIGFCTLGNNPDYFLFIHTSVEDLNNIVHKYGLESTL